MQDDERRAGAQSGLLDDIRRIVEEEGRPRPPAAFEPASQAGVLPLTAEMRTDRAAARPRDPLPPAEDEEPPLLLTRRVDQPEQPFGTGSASTAPSDAPFESAARTDPEAEASAHGSEQSGLETPAPGSSWSAGSEPASPEASALPPASSEPATPEPELFAAVPATPPAEEAHPDSRQPAPETESDAEEPPLTAEPPERSPGVVAARVPRFGAPYGQSAATQDVRRAFSSDSAPGPIPASGLPRSREELLALTRQAIRDELAGPLGERISQNIKLLIEREVRRAIADLARDRDEPGR